MGSIITNKASGGGGIPAEPFQILNNDLLNVLSLGWEESLEKEMTTQSSILAWDIPRTEELGVL